MLIIDSTKQDLLVHAQSSVGPIPTAFDPEGVYPYPSFCETADRPHLRSFQGVVLENDWMRAEILPELGGKLYSLRDKTTGCETLFKEPIVRPARILPRMAFISGGLEVSFPISHTPSQIEQVHVETRICDGRVYCFCGERERRFGMQWTLEFSLGENDRYLTQRLRIRNPSERPHLWMSWSNAAVPARSDTNLHFPSGSVLSHSDIVIELDWETQGPKTQSDISRMTGYFWHRPDVYAFGVFTPSLGSGLYHIADPKMAPGIKLWSYGMGDHRRWSHVSTLSCECYLEIQGGPIADQSMKCELKPGEELCFQEFWIPTSTPLDIHRIELPNPKLLPVTDMPLFSWPLVPYIQAWRQLIAESHTDMHQQAWSDNWAPSGMDDLGPALERLYAREETALRSFCAFQLGAWFAGRDAVDHALFWLARSTDDRAFALAARLHRFCRKDATTAVRWFGFIRSEPFALHPQVVVERDLALAMIGATTLHERQTWLDRVVASSDESIVERRAQLAFDQGRPQEALKYLMSQPFQLVHQRYVRSDLLRSIVGSGAVIPESLGEDDLARWGAYREYQE